MSRTEIGRIFRRATSPAHAMLQCRQLSRGTLMAVDLLNVKGLQALDPLAPVVMVNLMRFRERSLDGDGSGWDAYLRYSALTVPMIKARGGTLLWTGNARTVALGPQDGNQWDYVALVYYPSVAAFIDMMTSADYENLSDPHRRSGCAEHMIIATAKALITSVPRRMPPSSITVMPPASAAISGSVRSADTV